MDMQGQRQLFVTQQQAWENILIFGRKWKNIFFA